MRAALAIVVGLLLGCAHAPRAPGPADTFWGRLEGLCGRAFEGRLAKGNESDAAFARAALVMHVRECSAEEIRISLVAGEDRSRTWIFSRAPGGLRLKHDHRHPDGSEDEITRYGGDTQAPGDEREQSFHADQHTAKLIPAAATNVWTVRVDDGRFAYELRRPGTDRHFLLEFDLGRPVPTPSAAWGYEGRPPAKPR